MDEGPEGKYLAGRKDEISEGKQREPGKKAIERVKKSVPAVESERAPV